MALDEGFVSAVPEEIRNDASFQEAAKGDPASFAKSYVESQKKLGSAIFLPEENLKPEEKQAKLNQVYERLGRPKTHTEYKVDVPAEIPIGVSWDDGRQDRVLQRLHALGLNNEQVNGAIKTYFEEAGQGMELFTPDGAKAVLAEEWKDQYESNIGAAKKALAKWGDEELMAFGDQSGIFNFPPLVKFLSKIGREVLREDSVPKNEGNARFMDKDTAKEKLAAILNDKSHPYHNKSKAGHAQATAEVLRLNEIIHGSEIVSVVG